MALAAARTGELGNDIICRKHLPPTGANRGKGQKRRSSRDPMVSDQEAHVLLNYIRIIFGIAKS